MDSSVKTPYFLESSVNINYYFDHNVKAPERFDYNLKTPEFLVSNVKTPELEINLDGIYPQLNDYQAKKIQKFQHFASKLIHTL